MTRPAVPLIPSAVVTTSWDDGHVLDIRLAEMLAARGIRGTFYIAPENTELAAAERLGADGWRELAENFEIGGHTLSHRRLTTLSLADADAEIRTGKARLEEATGRPVSSFCYPGGRYREHHVTLLRQAGFHGARTVRRLSTGPVADPFAMRTTVQARPHVRDWPGVAALHGGRPVPSIRCMNWATLAVTLFDRVLAAGGVFHLWGHSWEINSLRQWDRLTRVLDHIGNRPGVRYLANGELLAGPGGSVRQP
jgi:peptidoglycan/xylan/chitin deacetylase (PgdA/CDA1 family)